MSTRRRFLRPGVTARWIGAAGGGAVDDTLLGRILSTQPSKLEGAWVLDDLTGSTATDYSGKARNGTFANLTLNQDGVGLRRSSFFNGTSSYVDILTAGLISGFNGSELTIGIYIKMDSSSVWTDGVSRRFIRITTDTGNGVITIRRQATNNELQWYYSAGGVTKTITKADGSAVDWFSIWMTVSKTGDQMKAYYNNAQVGTTQTGLGVWGGAMNLAILGAGDTIGSNVHKGYQQFSCIYSAALTLDEITRLSNFT